MPPLFLDLEEALLIHDDQIKRYGGAGGIRDLSLLQSALAMPQAGSGTAYSHVDLFEMAAAYVFHIVKNHPFLDGNKRTGIVAALVFLEMNGVRVRATNEALFNAVLAVAAGTLQKSGIAEFFRKHSRA
ncbi:MAG TPA: type II toxin-antitoxin system death-on-curing family toxin [bacterium]|nr:type II toxin-antitoxin system death-on-curing family toxin [bacterium]